MSIASRCLTVGPLASNCYVIWDADTKHGAIIDPGGDKDRITDAIKSLGIDVKYVLLTHGHPDHAFHAGELAHEFGAEIAMHESDIPMLADGLGIVEMFYDTATYVDFVPSRTLCDGDTIPLGDSRIKAVHTPGHSQGGLCFVTDAGAFCGDTIFAGSVGRTDFPGGSMEEMLHSIRTQILTLRDDTALYPGHGPATTVAAERNSNPYLHNAH